MFAPLGEGILSRFPAVPLVLQPHSLRRDGKAQRFAQLDCLTFRLLRNGKLSGDGNGNGFGWNGIIQSVGHYAIELCTVPRYIGCIFFGRLRVFAPLGEGILSRFPAIPLVLQTHSLRRDGKVQRFAQLDCLTFRLLRNGKLSGDGNGNGFGWNGIIQSVGHDAIELCTVPRYIGRK